MALTLNTNLRHSTRPACTGWFAALLLLLLACGVYANSFPGQYFLDDCVAVQTNPLVSELGLVKIFSSDYWGPDVNSGLYRPLVILSFAVKHQLFGPEPFADHMLNLVLHALVSLVLYLVLLRWEVGRPVAWLAAALFAVHPIHTEVINEAVGRAELLAALGVLLVLLVARTIQGWQRYPLLILGFLVGVLSKENAITVLAMLPLLDYYRGTQGLSTWWSNYWRSYGCLATTTLAWLALRIWGVQRWTPPDGADPVYTQLKFMEPVERILTALQIQWLYLWKQLVPIDLRGIYSGPGYLLPVDSPWSLLGVALVLGSLALLGFGVWLYWRRQLLGLVILLYAVAFLPTANIIFPTGVTMAERLAYLPSVWFCLGLSWLLIEKVSCFPWRHVSLCLCVLFVIGLAGRTLARNTDFRDEVTLWEADTRNDPQNVMAWMYLANQYWEKKEINKSEMAFQKALQVVPDFPEALTAYASFLLDQKRPDEALRYALHAGRIDTANTPTLHMVTANIYLELGNPQEAAIWHDKARWLYSKDDYFLFLQGWIYESLGDVNGALAAYRQIQKPLEQWRLDARLSTFLLNQGDYVGAEAFLRRSVELGETAETWNNLGIALALQGKKSEAAEAFNRAMVLDPDSAGYRDNYLRMSREKEDAAASPGQPIPAQGSSNTNQ